MYIEMVYTEDFSGNLMLNIYCALPRGTRILYRSKIIFPWNVLFRFYRISTGVSRNKPSVLCCFHSLTYHLLFHTIRFDAIPKWSFFNVTSKVVSPWTTARRTGSYTVHTRALLALSAASATSVRTQWPLTAACSSSPSWAGPRLELCVCHSLFFEKPFGTTLIIGPNSPHLFKNSFRPSISCGACPDLP